MGLRKGIREIGCIVFLIMFLNLTSFSLNLKGVYLPLPFKGEIENAISQYESQNFQEALMEFKKIYRKNPNLSVVAYYMGLCYKELGSYKRALYYFERAVSLKPPVENAYVEAAYILYTFNRFNKALGYLREAEKYNHVISIVYKLELSIFSKQRRYDDQIKVLRKMKKILPSKVAYLDLQIAVLYFKEREFNKAKSLLNDIILKYADTSEAKKARVLLARINKICNNWRYFSAYIRVGTTYDTNVVNKPSEKIGLPTVDDISRKKDVSLSESVSLRYMSLPSKYFRFRGGVFFVNQEYRRLKAYSYKALGADLIPFWSSLRFPMSGGLRLHGVYFWLNNRKYMRTYGVGGFFNYMLTPKSSFKISLDYTKRKMLNISEFSPIEEDRSGSIYLGDVSLKEEILRKRFYVIMGIGGERQVTRGSDWDSKSLILHTRALYRIKKDVMFNVRFSYKSLRFLKNNIYSGINLPGFPTTKSRRRDKIYTWSFGFNVKLKKNISLRLFDTYVRDYSNFSIYRYKRNVSGVVLTYAIY